MGTLRFAHPTETDNIWVQAVLLSRVATASSTAVKAWLQIYDRLPHTLPASPPTPSMPGAVEGT